MYILIWFKEAKKEYDKLDGSQKIQVNKGLLKIEELGMKTGKKLEKKKYDLSKCNEIKMKRLGLRIIFKENQGGIDIIDIVSIGRRSDNEIFNNTIKRIK